MRKNAAKGMLLHCNLPHLMPPKASYHTAIHGLSCHDRRAFQHLTVTCQQTKVKFTIIKCNIFNMQKHFIFYFTENFCHSFLLRHD